MSVSRAFRRKHGTKETQELSSEIMIWRLVVAAHREKLFPGEKCSREQHLFVGSLVQDWTVEQYASAARAIIDDLRQRGIPLDGLDDGEVDRACSSGLLTRMFKKP